MVIAPAPQILAVMGSEELAVADILHRLSQDFDLGTEGQVSLLAVITARLEELALLGLVERLCSIVSPSASALRPFASAQPVPRRSAFSVLSTPLIRSPQMALPNFRYGLSLLTSGSAGYVHRFPLLVFI